MQTPNRHTDQSEKKGNGKEQQGGRKKGAGKLPKVSRTWWDVSPL